MSARHEVLAGRHVVVLKVRQVSFVRFDGSSRVLRTDGHSRPPFPFLQRPHLYREIAVLHVIAHFPRIADTLHQRTGVRQLNPRKRRDGQKIISRMILRSLAFQVVRRKLPVQEEHAYPRFSLRSHLRRRHMHHARNATVFLCSRRLSYHQQTQAHHYSIDIYLFHNHFSVETQNFASLYTHTHTQPQRTQSFTEEK